MHKIALRPVAAAALLGLLFLSISLGLIASGRGIPAVFDGNETFSSILHAKNTLAFGPRASAGLADKSTSPHPQGHPVVHTHQGNFPRLYATVLSAIGLSDPAAQVVATVFPIGIASVFLLFLGLRRYVSPGFAFASLAILLTDYVLFAQWQVVTYRIWQFAFTAVLLATAIAYRERPRRWLLVATFAVSLMLFYYELVFASFLAVSVAAFTLLLWRREIASGVVFVSAQFAGALAGAGILIAQLAGYLGWDNFLTDMRLTYIGRNAGIADPATLGALRGFVEHNNIAFLYNFIDGSGLRSFSFFLDSIFRWGLQTYTPPFVFCIVTLAFSILVALFARNGPVQFPKSAIAGIAVTAVLGWLFGASGIVFAAVLSVASMTVFVLPRARNVAQTIGSIDAALLISVPAIVLCVMAATFAKFGGYERGSVHDWINELAFGLAVLALILVFAVRAMPQRSGGMPLAAALRGAAVLCVAIAFAQFHHRLYDGSLRILWQQALPGAFMPPFLQNLAMLAVAACAAALAVFGPELPERSKAPLRETTQRVAILIGSFLLGLLVVMIVFPGYVYSGYMARYLNLLVLPFALFAGWVLYATGTLAVRFFENANFAARARSVRVAGAAAFAASGLLIAWWLAIQSANARLFPADGLAVAHALRALPSDAPKTIANSYPAPFAVATGQWSYLDESFSSGRIVFSPASGYGHPLDRKYLWFADRATNPDYNKPDAFICLLSPGYQSAAQQLVHSGRVNRCADNGIVQWTARNEPKTWPHHTISGRDQSGRDAWAIVSLDWDFPPYLPAAPKLTAGKIGDAIALTAAYDFRQQDAKTEYRTDIEIWPVARNGSFCAVRGAPVAVSAAHGGSATLVLPQANPGMDMIVLARPQTETRVGPAFFTTPFRIDRDAVLTTAQSCGILRDAGGRHWSRIEGD